MTGTGPTGRPRRGTAGGRRTSPMTGHADLAEHLAQDDHHAVRRAEPVGPPHRARSVVFRDQLHVRPPPGRYSLPSALRQRADSGAHGRLPARLAGQPHAGREPGCARASEIPPELVGPDGHAAAAEVRYLIRRRWRWRARTRVQGASCCWAGAAIRSRAATRTTFTPTGCATHSLTLPAMSPDPA